MQIVAAFLACVLGGGTARALAPDVPLVALAGKYGENYTDLLSRTGCNVRALSEEQLADKRVLARFDVIIVSHLDYGWPDGAERALSDWVAKGGLLVCEIAAAPPKPILGEVPVTLGWAPGIVIVDSRSPLAAGLRRGDKLSYGAWGGGLQLRARRRVRIIARWDMSALQDSDKPIEPGFAKKPAAWVEIEHGSGLCVYSGAGLFILRPEAVANLVEDFLGPAALPLMQLKQALSTPVAAEPKGRSSTIAVLSDPELPIVGLPDGPSPAAVARMLQAQGYRVRPMSSEDLSNEAVFNAQRLGVLVLAHGEAFPLDAVVNFKRFLAQGGRVLSLAGVPLSHLCMRDRGEVVDCGEILSLRRGTIDLLFQRLLPYSKLIRVRKTMIALNLAPEWLPNVPLRVGRCEDAVLLMHKGNGLSSHTQIPLIGAIDRSGDLLGIPLSFSPYVADYPGAAMLAIGFRGKGHPLAGEAGAALLGDCIELLLRRNYILIEDLWTSHPCYYNGEIVQFGTRLRSQADQEVKVFCVIQERDPGYTTAVYWKQVRLRGGTPTDLSWTWKLPKHPLWAYDIIMRVTSLNDDPPPVVREETEFLVFDPDMARQARGFQPSWWGKAERDGTSCWLSGANFYFADSRGVGFFFTPTSIPGHHPLPDFLDRDASYIRLFGGNAGRQHYFDAKLTAESFDRQPPDHGLRTLDAYNLLLARHDIVSLCDPHTFDPNHYWKRKVKKWGAFTDARFIAEDQEYYRRIAERPAKQGFRNIFWEVINEPEGFGRKARDPEERLARAQQSAEWMSLMQQAVANGGGGPAGLGQSTATFSPVWDARGNLYPLPISNVHSYSSAPINESNGQWCVPFSLNYGRPAVVGEFGQPNATQARTIFLGDWTVPYDQVLHIIFGERAIGFVNFYLNCGMGSWASPEWGMFYPDYTEKPAALQWKRWNILCSLIRPADIADPTFFIFFDSQQRLREPEIIHTLNAAYLRSLSRGVFAQFISDHDLRDMLEEGPRVDGIFVPKVVKPSREAAALLDAAAKRGWTIWHDDDPFEKAAKHSTPIRVIENEPRLTYIRALVEGGWLVTLVGGTGEPVNLRAGDHKYRVDLPEGRCAVLGLTSECELFLFEGAKSVEMDKKPLASGPPTGFLVCSRKRRPIASEPEPLIWADIPTAVRISGEPTRAWPENGQRVVVVPTTNTPDARDCAALITAALRRKDVDVEIRDTWPTDMASGDLLRIAIGPPTDPLIPDILRATGRVKAMVGEGKSSFLYGSARIGEPWSGVIAWDRYRSRLAITGLTPAAINMAARKLTHLVRLDTYSTGPFSRTDVAVDG